MFKQLRKQMISDAAQLDANGIPAESVIALSSLALFTPVCEIILHFLNDFISITFIFCTPGSNSKIFQLICFIITTNNSRK